MRIKRRMLSSGWYPTTATEVRRTIRGWEDACESAHTATALAGIVPHAGWHYSGELAFRVIRLISSAVETVVVVGGHLASDAKPRMTMEDRLDTPVGGIDIDVDLRERLMHDEEFLPDNERDNTVEVQLPIIKELLPYTRLVAMRCPPTRVAQVLGEVIGTAAGELGRSVAVIGSTDLTHYGSQYGFAPMGSVARAYRWVKENSDAGMIDILLRMDTEGAIEYASTNHAACSVGGAVTAFNFAASREAVVGRLLDYRTSYDRGSDDSIVGYAAIGYFPAQ